MNVTQPQEVVDDVDDRCSCYSYDSAYESVYLSFCESLGRPQSPVQWKSETSGRDIPASPLHDIPELNPLAFKDQRSYERAKKRRMKFHDRTKAKGITVSCRCDYCIPQKLGGNTGKPKMARFRRGDFTEGKQDDGLLLGDSVHTVKDRPLVATPVERNVIVPLADLMKPPKKGTDKRFELIDRPRQVLVLDDFTEIDASKYDVDDWEYIDLNPKQRKVAPQAPRLSYARVVASKA